MLSETNKVSKRNCSLEKSLASSRNHTPDSSPRRKSRSLKSTRKNKKMTRTPNKLEDDKSEYTEVLNSFLNLKQGKAEAYSDLVEQAMSTTDNILKLKKDRQAISSGNKNKIEIQNSDNESPEGNKALQLLSALQTMVSSGEPINNSTIGRLIGDVASDDSFIEDNMHGDNATKEEKIKRRRHSRGTKHDETKDESSDRKKKLVSGKCAKPDETDIKMVVRFPHEKLDPRHTTINDRCFDKLPFHLLVAGELEIAGSPEVPAEERLVRIQIVKTICYHKAYLKDEDLCNGYDQLVKKIEQGKEQWSESLRDKLHEYYDYQANKLFREKLQLETSKNDREVKQDQTTRIEKFTETEKIVYCGLYNKGKCPQPDHHEGRFSNRNVMKWHICSRCVKLREKKSHPESECPIKA